MYQYLWYLGEYFRRTPILMLSQQMRSCDSIKIEAVVPSATGQLNNESCRLLPSAPGYQSRQLGLNRRHLSPTDASSIAVTNYNIQRTIHEVSPRQPTSPISLLQRSTIETVSYYEYYSQTTACIATSFGECGIYTTLDKLWYFYSYIYHCLSSKTMTIILTLLFIVVAILMPTSNLPTKSTSIVSPSPHTSRTRPFTMTNYTTIPGYSFEFGTHPTCNTLANALNNSYAEDFDTPVVASFFTDASQTTVTPNIIFIIREAIIATVLLSSTADRTVVAPIINRMPLFGQFGNPTRKFLIRSPSTFTSALDATLTTPQRMHVVIRLNTASLWLDSDNYNVIGRAS